MIEDYRKTATFLGNRKISVDHWWHGRFWTVTRGPYGPIWRYHPLPHFLMSFMLLFVGMGLIAFGFLLMLCAVL